MPEKRATFKASAGGTSGKATAPKRAQYQGQKPPSYPTQAGRVGTGAPNFLDSFLRGANQLATAAGNALRPTPTYVSPQQQQQARSQNWQRNNPPPNALNAGIKQVAAGNYGAAGPAYQNAYQQAQYYQSQNPYTPKPVRSPTYGQYNQAAADQARATAMGYAQQAEQRNPRWTPYPTHLALAQGLNLSESIIHMQNYQPPTQPKQPQQPSYGGGGYGYDDWGWGGGGGGGGYSGYESQPEWYQALTQWRYEE